MRLLIVEDDEEKASRLEQFMFDTYRPSSTKVCRSFQSGLRAALSETFDLLLLDMTMTNYDRSLQDDGGRPHHFAGREILRQLAREDVHIPVIVVTQFGRFGEEAEAVTLSELETELQSRFPDYLGTVHYRSNADNWKSQLETFIGHRFPKERQG
ncbi:MULTISPECIES: response regulator [Agrobacterium]|uniref:Response regulator n=1 Tax=Agrobacterium tumefaciens TaxID=358 RepID=A0AAE6BIT6_AGRTU|nr:MULTISPECIES: response regulator [Agrobacterium]QCL76470.1 response regulator [Agrobacterium tumefaciens]QCL81989.1 response regulator [Agrobacterium tumefaciens]CUX67045.1 Response regulator receiver protein [Agrobacterium sp. NCPPB 925]